MEANTRLDRSKLSMIEKMLIDKVNRNELAGATCLVWHRDEVVLDAAVGYRDIAARLPMERDSLFRIASMSKPVTSVLTMMMLEEGKLALDEPITRWLPEFSDMRVLAQPDGTLDQTVPAARGITVEDLLTHRSGLGYTFTLRETIAQAYDEMLGSPAEPTLAPDEWLDRLGSLPLIHQPGAQFEYGHSTDVLGFLLTRISGRTLGELLEERIFAPLGMVDTSFTCTFPGRAAHCYDLADGQPRDVTALRLKPLLYESGGGGLYSTASDYLKFARMLLGSGQCDGVRLLRSDSVALLTQNRLTPEQRAIPMLGLPMWSAFGFGLGVSVLEDENHPLNFGGRPGAFGWPGAFGTWWQADPDNDLIAIYLIQDHMELYPGSYWDSFGRPPSPPRLTQIQFQQAIYEALVSR